MPITGAVYLLAALLGAALGGLISYLVSTRAAKRERRARYGESLLATLNDVMGGLDAPVGHDRGQTLSVTREFAIPLWAKTELASTLETRAGRVALRQWGWRMYDLLHEESNLSSHEVSHRVELGVYLVIAWTAGHARGTDFDLPDSEIEHRFGPGPVPAAGEAEPV